MSNGLKSSLYTKPWVYPEVPSDLRAIFYENCQIRTIKKGEKICFNLGSIENGKKHLVYVKSGRLLNYRETSTMNKELFTGIIMQNSVAGHSNFLNFSDNSEFLIASLDSDIMVLPVARLTSAFTLKTGLKESVYNYFITCLKSESEGAHIIGTRPIDERVKVLLSTLVNLYHNESENENYEIPIKFSNEEIRKVIFATRKTINTLIPKWKKSKLYLLKREKTIINKELITSC